MKLLRPILIVTAGLLMFCGCDRNPEYDPPEGLEGSWEGIAIAGYPGPADEPLVDTARIYFYLEDGKFTYSGRMNPTDSLIIQRGTYTEQNDTVWLEPEVSIYAYHPLYLYGGFSIELSEPSLRLYQVHHPEGWADYHDVKLTRVRPMPD